MSKLILLVVIAFSYLLLRFGTQYIIIKKGREQIRKKPLHYKIVYDYPAYTKQYEDIKLHTMDRNEAMLFFLDLYKMRESNSLNLDSDCFVRLITEINPYIRGQIDLSKLNDTDNLDKSLKEIEKRLTTSYKNIKYTLKLRSGPEFSSNYEILFESENKRLAFKKFMEYFKQKQKGFFKPDSKHDVVLELSISPFYHDSRCLYLKYVKSKLEIKSKLMQYEVEMVLSFRGKIW
jgi:hypothetical protein